MSTEPPNAQAPLDLDRSLDAAAGEARQLSRLVTRIIAPNPGAFTFTGTCSYLVGTDSLAVIDPGPEDEAHLAALTRAIGARPVSHILVTHTHKDHSPLARRLQALTGAPIFGSAPHRPARPLAMGEINALDASADMLHVPDVEMSDGDAIAGDGWTLEAVATPGHTANHLAFALREEEALFSGDHVMAWSTSIVAPPDGAMAAYLASLERMRARGDRTYWPGHGGPVAEPQRFLRGLLAHRHQREAAILRRLTAGDRLIGEITPRVYEGLDPRLLGAAALSVFAHLEHLVERGAVVCDADAPMLDSGFTIA
jgi:glyoxylase-like metal-dependent hydrolase (beta-lactamase superfamily II)